MLIIESKIIDTERNEDERYVYSVSFNVRKTDDNKDVSNSLVTHMRSIIWAIKDLTKRDLRVK